MYELYGWIKLHESLEEIDEGGLDAKVKSINDLLDYFGSYNPIAKIFAINGEYLINFMYSANRENGVQKHFLAIDP